MAKNNSFTRRRFVKLAAVGTGGIYLLPGCSGPDSR